MERGSHLTVNDAAATSSPFLQLHRITENGVGAFKEVTLPPFPRRFTSTQVVPESATQPAFKNLQG